MEVGDFLLFHSSSYKLKPVLLLEAWPAKKRSRSQCSRAHFFSLIFWLRFSSRKKEEKSETAFMKRIIKNEI